MQPINMLMIFWKKDKWLIAGIAVLTAGMILSLFYGNGDAVWRDFFNAFVHKGTSPAAVSLILYGVRIPRLMAGVFCGMALSVSGLLMQESLNNRLASPSVMGINNGAGLFALLGTAFFGNSFVVRGMSAFAGAMVAVAFVALISIYAGSAKSTMILAGVAVSAMMSAFVNLIITLKPELVMDKTAFQLGSLQSVPAALLRGTCTCAGMGLAVSFLIAPGMELFSLGDEVAVGLGLSVRKYRYMCIFLAAFMSAAAVSSCGLLSFVGLIIPNLVRRMEAESIRRRLLLCAVWGSALVVFADFMAKSICYPYELPVGMLLSILGAPFFILIITGRRKRVQ